MLHLFVAPARRPVSLDLRLFTITELQAIILNSQFLQLPDLLAGPSGNHKTVCLQVGSTWQTQKRYEVTVWPGPPPCAARQLSARPTPSASSQDFTTPFSLQRSHVCPVSHGAESIGLQSSPSHGFSSSRTFPKLRLEVRTGNSSSRGLHPSRLSLGSRRLSHGLARGSLRRAPQRFPRNPPRPLRL